MANVTRAQLLSVFKSIGSEDRLESILLHFYQNLAKDMMLHHFFKGHDLHQIAKKQKNLLLAAMGQKKKFEGVPPALAHEKIPPIFQGHFDRRLKILEDTLNSEGLPAEDIRTWLEFERKFRTGVVKKQ